MVVVVIQGITHVSSVLNVTTTVAACPLLDVLLIVTRTTTARILKCVITTISVNSREVLPKTVPTDTAGPDHVPRHDAADRVPAPSDRVRNILDLDPILDHDRVIVPWRKTLILSLMPMAMAVVIGMMRIVVSINHAMISRLRSLRFGIWRKKRHSN